MAATTWIVIAVVFVLGVLLLGISSAMLRSPEAPGWPKLVDESMDNADVQLRLDMVERLAILNNAWSRDVLERAKAEERNNRVRSAIEGVLQR